MTPPRSKGEFESRRSLACPSRPTGRAASLKRMTSGFESREGYAVWPGFTTALVCTYQAARLSLAHGPMEGEPARRRARPLSDARVTPSVSITAPSAMEDEPARVRPRLESVWAPLGAGHRALRPLPSPACSHRAGELLLESEPARARGPFRRRIGVRALGIVSSALRSGRCAAGAAAGLEPSRRESLPRGSTPPSSSQWPRPSRSTGPP